MKMRVCCSSWRFWKEEQFHRRRQWLKQVSFRNFRMASTSLMLQSFSLPSPFPTYRVSCSFSNCSSACFDFPLPPSDLCWWHRILKVMPTSTRAFRRTSSLPSTCLMADRLKREAASTEYDSSSLASRSRRDWSLASSGLMASALSLSFWLMNSVVWRGSSRRSWLDAGKCSPVAMV